MTNHEAIEKYVFSLNLARYLLAQNPPHAEFQMQMLKNSLLLGDEVKKGNWVIVHDFGENMESYIVVRDGQPMSTNVIPEWATDYPRKHVSCNPDANPIELLELLQNTLGQFEERYEPIVSFLSAPVSSAARYYNSLMVDLEEADAIAELCTSAESHSDVYEILLQEQIKLISSYDTLNIPGDSVILPLCIIYFFRQFDNAQVKYNFQNTLNTFIRHPQHNFVRNPEASVLAVQSLYNTGDRLKNAAQKEYTFYRFYNTLYEALIFYRSALYMGTLLINNGITNESLKHIVYMSEEMRVIIWSSIMPITRNKTPDFLIPVDIFAWLGVISDKKQKNPNICSPSLYCIHDFYASLCYPAIYRDIALEVYKISRKMTVSTRKLEKCICQLEKEREKLTHEVHVIDFLKRYIHNIKETQ